MKDIQHVNIRSAVHLETRKVFLEKEVDDFSYMYRSCLEWYDGYCLDIISEQKISLFLKKGKKYKKSCWYKTDNFI